MDTLFEDKIYDFHISTMEWKLKTDLHSLEYMCGKLALLKFFFWLQETQEASDA